MNCNNRDMYYNPRYSQNVLCQGPSPVIPFLLVVCVGSLVCWEYMPGYYERTFEVTESIGELLETLPLLLIIAIFVVILSYSFMCDTFVSVVPIGMLLLVFLLQNEVLCIIVLLLVVSFFSMYTYPSHNGGSPRFGWSSNWSRVPEYQSRRDCRSDNVESGERRSSLPLNLTPGQICYLIMIGCLVTCTVNSEAEDIWWTCMALLLLCVLYVNFSGRGNREWVL